VNNQSDLDLTTEKKAGPVECLGQTFKSDEARRAHYTELLREKLQDPEFRMIEGFPIGEDEDILNLSDPPFYTACPNPWIGDFIKAYGRPYDPKEKYHREPFAADVSEGKNHPIYNAHSYHTKVPHRAIMRYILHYTEPGDVVFDGFCGTGMTGVAAQLCGDEKEVRELGYRIDPDGTICNEEGKAFSKLGARRAVLNDLSPIASWISSAYNSESSLDTLETEFQCISEAVDGNLGWVYTTLDSATNQELEVICKRFELCNSLNECGKLLSNLKCLLKECKIDPVQSKITLCRLNYSLISDVFTCPESGGEFTYWDAAVDTDNLKLKEEVTSPYSGSIVQKGKLEYAKEKYYDAVAGLVCDRNKREVVYIDYSANGKRRRKIADQFDLCLAQTIERLMPVDSFPVGDFPVGDKTAELISKGASSVWKCYTPRNLLVLREWWKRTQAFNPVRFCITSILVKTGSLLHNVGFKKGSINLAGALPNALYIPSILAERNINILIAGKKNDLAKAKNPYFREGNFISSAASTTDFSGLRDNSIDYVFVDPPFGSNLMYSELNFIWEGWLKVFTNNKNEAIENRSQEKSAGEYKALMIAGFSEIYRTLKPGRWLTVEFSNTTAGVWNTLQAVLQQSGFIVANVAMLLKGQGTFNSQTNPTSVKQDIAITAYKPSHQIELQFSKNSGLADNVWEFIKHHLNHLPVVKPRAGQLERIAERDPRILYDRMVAFYIGHNTPVPLSSGEFQAALAEKFPERDGMFFLHEQVAEYDKKAAQMEHTGQMSIFVDDEKSAINWLRQFLKDRPSVVSDITSEFMQQLSATWKKFESRPELALLLEQNFIKYNGETEVPGQIHGYLSTNFKDMRNKEKDDAALKAKAKDRWYVPDPKNAIDVEAQREKRLLAEFWEYAEQAGIQKSKPGDSSQASLPIPQPAKKKAKLKKLKEVRTEAIRTGFMLCNRSKDATTILAVAEILPPNVIEEDEQLQMIYDMAEMRAE